MHSCSNNSACDLRGFTPLSLPARNHLAKVYDGLVAEAVRSVCRRSVLAARLDSDELRQVGRVALLESLERVTDEATSRWFLFKRICGAVRNYVAKWNRGTNYSRLRNDEISPLTITNVSCFDEYKDLVPPTGGDSYWVRGAVGHPPRSMCAIFSMNGFPVSTNALCQQVVRRVRQMVV